MAWSKFLRKGVTVVKGLHEKDADPDPIRQFARWFEEAKKTSLAYPEAMSAATATPDGKPSVRMVLLKGFDERGFTFFTNYESRKGSELEQNAQVALLFYWEPFERQVRIEGPVERVSEAESMEYFRTRPRGSRIGAWASAQSALLADRAELERRVNDYDHKFSSDDIPLPPHWGGYRCRPQSIEFWQGRVNRLHDRLCYLREGDGWRRVRLSP